MTNTGNASLTGVAVTDDRGVVVTCPQTVLAAGASMNCTAPPATAVAGQYENVASATGLSNGVTVQDSDPSHYFGEDALIDIEKATNGVDADQPPGPLVNVGDQVVRSVVRRRLLVSSGQPGRACGRCFRPCRR